jgi:hypothetical protein
MSGYTCDRAWSDHFIDPIRRIVGPHLLVPSSFEVDTKEAADLVVLRGRGDLTVAARVRRHGYAERFPNDFTIRSDRATGTRTELAKVLDGFGSVLFYGHQASPDDYAIGRWLLIDLDAFRQRYADGWTGRTLGNGDGTWFRAFDITEARGEPRLVIASDRRPQLGQNRPGAR